MYVYSSSLYILNYRQPVAILNLKANDTLDFSKSSKDTENDLLCVHVKVKHFNMSMNQKIM